MKITEARRADLPRVAELFVTNWKQTYRGILPEEFLQTLTVEQAISHWQAQLDHGLPLLVAWEGERFLGFCASQPEEEIPACVYLASLHVTETARGQGVGTALLRQVAAVARKDGYRRMSISIFKGNDRARALYAKLGAVHYKDFTDNLSGGWQSQSEKLVWNDLDWAAPLC